MIFLLSVKYRQNKTEARPNYLVLRKVQNTGYLVPQIGVHFVGLLGEKIPKKGNNRLKKRLKIYPNGKRTIVDLISFHPKLYFTKMSYHS